MPLELRVPQATCFPCLLAVWHFQANKPVARTLQVAPADRHQPCHILQFITMKGRLRETEPSIQEHAVIGRHQTVTSLRLIVGSKFGTMKALSVRRRASSVRGRTEAQRLVGAAAGYATTCVSDSVAVGSEVLDFAALGSMTSNFDRPFRKGFKLCLLRRPRIRPLAVRLK